ncbi:phosphate ABC transporter permease subunit PstC [Bdellovibrio sp. PAP01]|uniref:Phosphate transport system permease protein n=2 Tax=Bdellovibrio svalbardensis TaxID=2972972 RepID=A0ABT6DKJ0_9BACT|nr:phosphate ABC transporter permease subunit PstC [Bdellovibrio svalbardensis]MDG0817377.1 phosphate ABC transporter permease subunit PstC [Bdellovibrio svalbardensis]
MSKKNQLRKLSEFTSADHPVRRMRRLKERVIEFILFLAAASSVLVTVGIVGILVMESIPFFETVTLKEFLTDTEWTPLFENAHYGILPLINGTFLTTMIALIVAIPLGTIAAAFLSEYVRPGVREVLKPILEMLAAVPTVVYGYFALLFVTPLLQKVIPSLGGFNVLSAGLVMGVMIIPYVSSLSEDAMRSVPGHLREASFAVGASRMQTAFRVVIPAAFSGITSAYVLGISRAFGETMVVAIAAGMQPNLTLNPTEPAATITAFIVQVSLGDLPHGSIGFRSIYVAGLSLLILTLCFNIIGLWLRKKFQEKE